MNKVLKWVLISLGILLALAVAAMFAFRGMAFRPGMMMGGRAFEFHHPFGGMMMGMGLFMLVRVLFGAAILGFAVFGIVALFRNARSKPANNAASATPEVPAAAVNAVPERVCVKCSKPLQAEWTNCPYCGKKQ